MHLQVTETASTQGTKNICTGTWFMVGWGDTQTTHMGHGHYIGVTTTTSSGWAGFERCAQGNTNKLWSAQKWHDQPHNQKALLLHFVAHNCSPSEQQQCNPQSLPSGHDHAGHCFSFQEWSDKNSASILNISRKQTHSCNTTMLSENAVTVTSFCPWANMTISGNNIL